MKTLIITVVAKLPIAKHSNNNNKNNNNNNNNKKIIGVSF